MAVRSFRIVAVAVLIVVAAGGYFVFVTSADRARRDRPAAGVEETQRPVQVEISTTEPSTPDWLDARAVRGYVRERRGNHDVSPEFRTAVQGFEATQRAGRKRPAPKHVRAPNGPVPVDAPRVDAPLARAAAAGGGSSEVVSFDSTSFGSNATISGIFSIPADPQGAAGPDHVITTTNTTVLVHGKTGAPLANASLAAFFRLLDPRTPTFDPRVLWDHYNQRWIIMTTERTDRVVGFPADTSRILLGVSLTPDPFGSWVLLPIDAVSVFFNHDLGGTFSHWVDFPQISFDDEAIYITGSMFTFFSAGGAFGGVRLWIVPKGEDAGGLYDGGTVFLDQYDPLRSPAIVVAGAPAMVFGTPASSTLGTYIVNYSGISNGATEAVQIVRIDDPLGTPTFTPSLVELGDIQDTAIGPPFMSPQAGSATPIASNDSGAHKAVLRDDKLWTTFSIIPPAGDPEAGQVTAHWLRLAVAGAPVLEDQGRVSGEDIAPGAHTFFPSLAVDADLDVVIGFAASSASIFPGAYYTLLTGSRGSVAGPSVTLRAGVDTYVRTLGGAINRWGDFSSVAIDPVDGCFWIYNNYAMAHGNEFDAGNGLEDGQWGTRAAKFRARECAGAPDTIANLRLTGASDTLLSWNDLGAGFRYDLVIGTLSVVRAGGGVGTAGCLASQLEEPSFVDDLPTPPAGEARYYILRGRSECLNGDYGSDSDGELRLPTPGCPD